MKNNNHFLKIIEKRVRKDIRINKLFQNNDRIILNKDNSKEFFVNEYLLKSILKEKPVKILYKGKGKKILNKNLDDICAEFLDKLLSNLEFNDEIVLLRTVTDKEVERFAKIKKFKFKDIKRKNKFKDFLDRLEVKHKETKYSLGKSIIELRKLL